MTQEDKQLLLKDLCMRLPYGVICNTPKGNGHLCSINQTIFGNEYGVNIKATMRDYFNDREVYIKPYLRPMSSMTEEEVKELLFLRLTSKYGESCAYIKNFIKLNEVTFRKESSYEGSIDVWFSFKNKIHDTSQIIEYSKCEHLVRINDITLAEIDWLLKNHFDVKGLIPQGLAIEVTEENNPYEK